MLNVLEMKNQEAVRNYMTTGDESFLDVIRENRKVFMRNNIDEILNTMNYEEKLSFCLQNREYRRFINIAKDGAMDKLRVIHNRKLMDVQERIKKVDEIQFYLLKIVKYAGNREKLHGQIGIVVAYNPNKLNINKEQVRVLSLTDGNIMQWYVSNCKFTDLTMEEWFEMQTKENEVLNRLHDKYYEVQGQRSLFKVEKLNSYIFFNRINKKEEESNRLKFIGNIVSFEENGMVYKGVCVNETNNVATVYLLPEYIIAKDFLREIKKRFTKLTIEEEFYSHYFLNNLFAFKKFLTDKYLFKIVNDKNLDADNLSYLRRRPIVFDNDLTTVHQIEEVIINVSNRRNTRFIYVKLAGIEQPVSMKGARIFKNNDLAFEFLGKNAEKSLCSIG